jgi:septal ring factor EnvC (AmiA/AmiB activator)
MRRALLIAVLALPLIGAAPPSAANKGASVADAARQRAMDRDEARAQAKTAAEEIVRLRQELIGLGAEEKTGEKTVGDRGVRLAALNAAEADLSARMGKNQVELARLLGALELYRRDPPPALLISPKNATDAVNAAILINAIRPELERRAKAFAAEARQLQTLRRNVVLANGALFTAESDVADRRTSIEQLIAQKSALERSLDANADQAGADVKRLAAEAKSLGQLVSGLDAREAQGGDAAALHLTAPVQGAPDRRFNDPWPGQARSEGWSWKTTPGAVVLTPADGRIDYAGPLKGWGLVLILRLAGDYHLVLAGLGAADGRIGSEVSAGEPIGHMAAALPVSKDKAAFPELYLEVRKGETPVDPARWLDGTAAQRQLKAGGH